MIDIVSDDWMDEKGVLGAMNVVVPKGSKIQTTGN
jgi:hypothetical protein